MISTIQCWKPREDWSDVYRIQAERDEAVGRGKEGQYRPLRATIDAAWLAGNLTGRDGAKRSHWPLLAACDAEEQMADRFSASPSRIQISRITLSKGWPA